MTKNPQQTIFVFHGDDEYRLFQETRAHIQSFSTTDTSGLNITVLEEKQTSLSAIQTALNTLPLLSDKRLTVLKELPARQDLDRLIQLLEKKPDTTLLIIELPDTFDRKNWKNYDPVRHKLAQWVRQHPRQALWQDFKLPAPYAMPEWIQNQARQMGGNIVPAAASHLAEWIGTDTFQAVQELEKLLTYTNRERAVTIADVEALSSNQAAGNIFHLVDALAVKNRPLAFQQLNRLLEEMEPQQVFSMIVRQYRLILITCEYLNDNGSFSRITQEIPEIRSDLAARKLWQQAQGFQMENLKTIYRHLLEMDQAVKTSQMTPNLILDIILGEWT